MRRLMLVAVFGMGCATTIAARHPLSTAAVAEVNQAIERREASAELVEELQPLKRVEVKDAEIGRLTTEWIEKSDGGEARKRSLPTAALRRITVRERDVGGLE